MFIEHYLNIQPSEPHVYSRTDAFTLSGFTTAFKSALNERNSVGHRAAVSAVCVRDRERSQTRAPNALSALVNKAFKVIVSCLTV